MPEQREDHSMTGPAGALELFTRAAVDWAGGGRGQPLVDAAADALAAGVDSPTLRVLAGAPRAAADEEATELTLLVFEELGSGRLIITKGVYRRRGRLPE